MKGRRGGNVDPSIFYTQIYSHAYVHNLFNLKIALRLCKKMTEMILVFDIALFHPMHRKHGVVGCIWATH